MGGESSKHSNSAANARSRERKRGALPAALTGGDCRAVPLSDRTTRFGPSYGEVPDYIPPSPVRCVASPIPPSGSLDPSVTWILDTEAVLITEWNRGLQGVCTPRTGALGALRGREGAGADSKLLGPRTLPESAASTVASITPGLTSSSTCPPLSGPPSPTHLQSSSGVSLTCDSVAVTTGRSTGMILRVPTTWTQSKLSCAGASSKAVASSTSSEVSPCDPAGGASSVVVSVLPVGIDYFRALQSRWLALAHRSLPPPADEEDLNDSVILEAVSEANGDVLSPPVPLGYMIDLFVPQWRSEGLYEAAQDYQTR
ncbi:hypothetical protein GH5_05231 [Leishmania sp. Ghana 2012 LV757]|uniref:hypothetical protein n=1 Tax=Leishmania sp. Ghana 2012 LV757 TaxID=2803181 RepID=UPI001B74FAE8|nr:hypothetical protein GH5_05231 [Leishmania sp. Ghana 2012 LV757]